MECSRQGTSLSFTFVCKQVLFPFLPTPSPLLAAGPVCPAGDWRHCLNEFIVPGFSLMAFIERPQPGTQGVSMQKCLYCFILEHGWLFQLPAAAMGWGQSRELGSSCHPGCAGLCTQATQALKSEYWTPAQLHTHSSMFPSQHTAHMKNLVT